MNAFIKQITCATTLGVTLAMTSLSQAGQGHSGQIQSGKGQSNGTVGQSQQHFQVAPRGGSVQVPFNGGTKVSLPQNGNTGIVPGKVNNIPINGPKTNGGLPIKQIDPSKRTLPFTPGKVFDEPKHTLPFNPQTKLPLDPNKGPVLPFNPNGPKIPLGPKGPVKPIDPGFGNGSHANHHHSWCGGIQHPNWICPTIWWYPTSCFCCNLNGGYFVSPVVTVVSQEAAVDVALVDVRFCDSGDAASKLGPRYRVTVRNNGLVDAGQFHMVVLAGLDKTPKMDAPASLVQVIGLRSGETKAFDVRLPVESLAMSVDATGNPAPFATLFVAVDSHEELNDSDRSNNGTVMNRVEIPLVN